MLSGSSDSKESKEQMSYPSKPSFDLNLETLQAGRTLPETIQQLIAGGDYQTVEFALDAALDEMDGIKTSIHIDPEHKEFPTGIAKIRDASMALPFDQRLGPDAPARQINNMLLRALGSMRGIDHALSFESKNPDDIYAIEKNSLQKAFAELYDKATKFLAEPTTALLNDKEIQQQQVLLHKRFNNALANILINTGLAEDYSKPKDFENLITHYRDLSSVLQPAKSLQTTFIDKQTDRNGEEKIIIHTDTAHPITNKTPEQLKQLAVMKTIGSGDDFHHSQSLPMQIANRAFHDLIAKNDTRLPAQTRKTIAPTVKNGYEVEYKIQMDDKKFELTSLRCGSMAYVGKGMIKDYAKEKDGDPYTSENLSQLTSYANKDPNAPQIPLHVGMLLTEITSAFASQLLNMEYQNEIIAATRGEAKKMGAKFSLTPVNWLGRAVSAIEVADEVIANVRNYAVQNNITFPSTSVDARVEDAALIALVVSLNPHLAHLITCASGQDRSGTIDELKTQLWTTQIYKNDLNIEITQKDIAEKRGIAGHIPTLASHAVTGSPGMKHDSEPKEIFSESMRAHYYTKIADTNKAKSMHVDEKALIVSLAAAKKFRECMTLLAQEDPSQEAIHAKLIEWARTLTKKGSSSNLTTMYATQQTLGEKIAQQCMTNIINSKTLTEALNSAPADFAGSLDKVKPHQLELPDGTRSRPPERANDKYLPELVGASRLIAAARERFPTPPPSLTQISVK
jgi:hypothetical protein